jgi:hypothetical protein
VKIFIIGPVRLSDSGMKLFMESYVDGLEKQGHTVHLPARDTDQTASGMDICRQNVAAIEAADEIHIFYNVDSTGSHFDMGAAFALNKKMVVVHNVEYGEGKSFPRMLDEWQKDEYVRYPDDGKPVEPGEGHCPGGRCTCGPEDSGG